MSPFNTTSNQINQSMGNNIYDGVNAATATIETVTVSECPYPEGTAKAVIWEKIEEMKSDLQYHNDELLKRMEDVAEEQGNVSECLASISDLQAALKKLEGE